MSAAPISAPTATRMSAGARRELVLAAATRAFAEQGYAATTTDTVARVVAEGLHKKHGKPVIVDSKPGAGGMLGLWLASAGVQALIRAYPTSVPRMSEVAIDVPVLLFALGVSIGTGVIFGLTPVTQGRLDGIVTALKGSGGRSSSGAARHHIRRVLVMAKSRWR